MSCASKFHAPDFMLACAVVLCVSPFIFSRFLSFFYVDIIFFMKQSINPAEIEA